MDDAAEALGGTVTGQVNGRSAEALLWSTSVSR